MHVVYHVFAAECIWFCSLNFPVQFDRQKAKFQLPFHWLTDTFSLSPTVYQQCIMLKTLQKITSDSKFTAYLVNVTEAFDKTSQSR